jgi:2-phosphosulfolactate phosphatase
MKITVIPHADEIHSNTLSHKTVVVIDVFRASSSIVTALSHGASAIIPAETVSEARQCAMEGMLLGGERFGKRLDGFDLCNSPQDYAAPVVRDKTIVMTTTNGTRTLLKTAKGADVIIGCFLNASACVRFIRQMKHDTVLLCAGTRGDFSLEDGIAAGCLLDLLLNDGQAVQANDLGLVLHQGYLSVKDHLLTHLCRSASGDRLMKRGLVRDLEDCLALDRYDVVPRWKNGRIHSFRVPD